MKFRTSRYPRLKVRLKNGKYVQFAEVAPEVSGEVSQRVGELETTDKEAIAVLKALPKDRGVSFVDGGGSSAKSADES